MKHDDAAREDAWRLEQLLALRFTPSQAENLVKFDIDWHEAARLIENGCPPKLAYRLLMPV